MARSRENIIPFTGRFGRRQPPYTRLFRGPRRRLARARRLRRAGRWLLPWLPFLLVLLYDGTLGERLLRDLLDGRSPPLLDLVTPDAKAPRPAVTVLRPPRKPVPSAARRENTDAASAPLFIGVAGLARVVDGDTLKIGRTRIRIDGIDAPEAKQTCTRRGRPWRCGDAATAHMAKLTAGRRVECEDHGTDRYGRMLGLCRVDGTDLGAAMVRAGLALAYRHYSTRYVPEETAARVAKRGVWAGEFTEPWVWRRGR